MNFNSIENRQEPNSGKEKRIQKWQVVAVYLCIFDAIAVNVAYFLGLWLRFDCRFSMIPSQYLDTFVQFMPFYTIFCVFIFYRFRLYNSIWKFASYNELLRVTAATGLCSVFHIVGSTLLLGMISHGASTRMPMVYYFTGVVMQMVFVLGVRFSYRLVFLVRRSMIQPADELRGSVMLIGAGTAGQMILRDLNIAKETKERVCCIIDDDQNKWGRFIEGVPVAGGRDSIMECVEKYKIDKIYVAIPSASAKEKRDILNICKETGCELKNLPGLYQLVTGEVTASTMREVTIEDLLGREQVKADMEDIFRNLKGKRILVTGGGGSIGSELCRQIAAHQPSQLVIFEIYENNAYDIEQELRKKFPELELHVIIGSVRDSRRVNAVFEKYKPQLVYHAAAHKHVPLMENSPCEAIKNNAIGTYKTAYAAMCNGCERFVLISTDKAVNPTNIMGASKRLCEMIIQSFDKMIKLGKEGEIPILHAHSYDEDGSMGDVKRFTGHSKTEFVAVRFGNVLGSNGSVIPLFKKQIAEGGPVTVTHPDIIRYFMTIPEAVSLVLQAGGLASGGTIFVLDMGEPVKIDDLARNLIKLSGFKPDVDIKLVYTGLRPGEKLYEERLMEEEGLKTTANKMINIGSPIPFDSEKFFVQLKELLDASYAEREDIRELVAQVVTTYREKSCDFR